ncbi:MAG: hypothetical protein JWM67_2521 [Mycobacterium sp.]|jgi:alpha/beta superfamily hydrolase|nr:hypothetical protein [Mycobacterium sp.]
MPAILANTVLPADRIPTTLHTNDGLALVGEWALPPAGTPVRATLVCLHPLPTQGGSMDSHVLRKAAWRLPALAGIAVLRFNTRGTSSAEGTSEGAFDAAGGERWDVAAALDTAEAGDPRTGEDLPAPWLLGWSFGTDLALKHGGDPSVAGLVLLSPPLRFTTDAELDAWADRKVPVVAVVPEFDDYLRPAAARERFARIPQAVVDPVDGAGHLWVGDADRVLDRVVAAVLPEAAPLPRSWDGPVVRGTGQAALDAATDGDSGGTA